MNTTLWKGAGRRTHKQGIGAHDRLQPKLHPRPADFGEIRARALARG